MRALFIFLLISNLTFGQEDKLLHASAGFVTSAMTTSVLLHYDVKGAPWIGFGVGAALGIGKEIYDKYTVRGNPELLDAACTIGGAALGSFTVRFAIRNQKKEETRKPSF